MATVLTVEAVEGSTYVVTASFTDEDGDVVVPNGVSWTLTDSDGDVVNSREEVAIGAPASSVDILLSGDDLEASPVGGGYLLITVTADYDSALGSGLPLIGQARIVVAQLEP